ncbi:MAG: hypothetical protein HOI47_01235 [Candidatus Scalindua sp.]|nr:hypothetical protein [Candidatus Scalindua sp.]MBT5305087.1 hypothetical protein [Candidatus Scalindua sp.]MBT6225257.1 hypothetical protein [Candidatus Scalindua sp.]MBT7212154.1 hypothetical protein [Candidatus Scalindua sp.]
MIKGGIVRQAHKCAATKVCHGTLILHFKKSDNGEMKLIIGKMILPEYAVGIVVLISNI